MFGDSTMSPSSVVARRAKRCRVGRRASCSSFLVVGAVLCCCVGVTTAAWYTAPLSSSSSTAQQQSSTSRPRRRLFLDASGRSCSARRYQQQGDPNEAAVDRNSRSSSKNDNRRGQQQRRFSREELLAQVEDLRTRQQQEESQADSSSTLISQADCDAVLASCVAADEWDTVLEVLDVMKGAGLTKTHGTFTRSLQACSAVNNAASAYEMWQAMEAATVAPNNTDLSLLVETLCRKARYEKEWYATALQVWEKETTRQRNDDVDWMKYVPLTTYHALLNEMEHRQEWKEALRLLQQLLDRSDPQPTSKTFQQVIGACVRAGRPEQAAQILLQSLDYPVPPTLAPFAIVIPSLTKKRHWRKALALLQLLESPQHNLTATTKIYNSILVALGKAKEFAQAKRLVSRMKQQDIPRDIYTYNSLMAAAAHRWQEALRVLDECHREPGVEPDVVTYTNAIRACSKGGKVSRALTFWQVVQDKELRLDAYIYTAAIEACAKGRLWERALDLLTEMQEKGIMPTEVTYSCAITACGNAGEWERSVDLLTTMRSKGLSPNLYTYNGAITAIAKSAKTAAKDEPMKEGQPIDENGRWRRVMDLMKQMRADGLEPDGFTYSSAISCCGSEGRWEEALELIDRMMQGGPATRPNKIAYTAAISSCGRSGQVDHALRLFAQMKEQGLSPDRVAYNTLFSALRVAKRSDVALELWDEMLGIKPSRSLNRKVSGRAVATDDSATPDVITATNAIGALSADDTANGQTRADRVFREAVERGIFLHNNRLDSLWDVDLSGMTLPVARAATRYILRQTASQIKAGKKVQDLTLITGVGHGRDRGTTLREYVKEVLERDFDPPLASTIPKRAQGTVVVDKVSLAHFAASR